ncbi:vomeronasal type-2 receptor 26-like [Hyla sarda]|uniref:vomeronasal type-2 receptor 26-like n=1 Tax=Hyla sarda TaxID=327740 RepID=UPI0024C339A7|nr:vomeronasal type-2 receptor 26-like [Hyla sarda]
MLKKILPVTILLNAVSPGLFLLIVGCLTLYFITSSLAATKSFSQKTLFYVLVLCILSMLTSQTPAPACRLQILQMFEDYGYFQDGDIIIGGVVTVHDHVVKRKKTSRENICFLPLTSYYKHRLAFYYSVDEINNDPSILPNMTLGYHIYDSCSDPRKAIKSILQILSGPGPIVPNYSCTRKKVVGLIGDHFSSTTLPIAQLLGIYPYTQISYGATDTFLNDRRLFPSFFRTVPDDYTIYSAISHFLSHFGWTWVGIISSDDDAGDRETRLLTNLLASGGICVDYLCKLGKQDYWKKNYEEQQIKQIRKSSARFIIFCGTFSLFIDRFLVKLVTHGITLILPPNFSTFNANSKYNVGTYNLSLFFDLSSKQIPEMRKYFITSSPQFIHSDTLLADLWVIWFKCLSGNRQKEKVFEETYKITFHECTKKDKAVVLLKWIFFHMSVEEMDGKSTQVYQAVHSLTAALHHMYVSHGDESTGHWLQKHEKLRYYVKGLMCPDESGKESRCFTEKGDKEANLAIYNIVTLDDKMSFKTLGSYRHSATGDIDLKIDSEKILWKMNTTNIPRSQCSPRCSPGHRKVTTSSIHLCCYDCAPCSEGEISNITDSKDCMKCPGDSWSHENRTFCVLKEMEYLSYTEDIISMAFFYLSSFFCILTFLIFAIIFINHDTPIVRANNKNLSFVLLVSIMLSFLCVFLFLGRPVDRTCMIRQIFTGILLSISISSLLAKTITVYIAFKATKPGSVWRTWTGVKLPNCVLLICSSIQGVICMSWVTLSPPFQELDTHSYKEKMVVQCNEGSDLWFYSVLGYMGILAAVSFITAFLARTLPDSFNEAKYITFSMLVFCSVWIAMIPAYLSTKGKYMVVVEIFAILASNTGLLGCIFFPKCYIILFKPELNTRKYIMETKNTKLHN